MSEFLRHFAQRFASLDAAHLHQLAELYSEDILFRDPLHEIQGLAALQRYFAELYSNVRELRFDVYAFDTLREGEGYLRWTMSYRHPRLAGGALIRVDGCSHLLWRDGRVYRHRDYFDAGAMLYEHLPVLGRVISWLKRRMG